MDTHSKWVEISPLADRSANTIMHWFFNDVICNHGCPKIVRCDPGKEFEKPFSTLCKNLNIKLIKGSTMYP